MKLLIILALCIVGYNAVSQTDTLASHLLVTHRPPSFAHGIEGFCITINGRCTGKHLVYRNERRWPFGRARWVFKPVGEGCDVWRCIRKEVGRD